MEAFEPLATPNFKGRFIKRAAALRCTVIKQSRGPAKMNGGNYQLYLLTAPPSLRLPVVPGLII